MNEGAGANGRGILGSPYRTDSRRVLTALIQLLADLDLQARQWPERWSS